MSEENKNNGCATPIILGIILIAGIIFRFVYDKNNLLQDMWGHFLGAVIILIVVLAVNNYRKN